MSFFRKHLKYLFLLCLVINMIDKVLLVIYLLVSKYFHRLTWNAIRRQKEEEKNKEKLWAVVILFIKKPD